MTQNNLRTTLKPYAKPNIIKSWLQIANTLIPYIILLIIMGFCVYHEVSYYFILPLSVLTGGFMVRTFILFHDCTHQSFFNSKKGNDMLGTILGILTFTPYAIWQSEHNKHHGSVGNLDQRGIGDVWTLTVHEYQGHSKFRQMIYRLYRHPVCLFIIFPIILFGIINRFPSKKFSDKKHHISLAITNIGILTIFLLTWLFVGLKYYLLIQLPVLFFASIMGVWMFFIQHQFEEVYWARHQVWDFETAALEGSSFYKLPWVLDWITGHIGYHHIHHLNAKIPNYHLRKCYKEIHGLNISRTIGFLESFKLAMLTLYDEKRHKLITLKDYKLIKHLDHVK